MTAVEGGGRTLRWRGEGADVKQNAILPRTVPSCRLRAG